MKSCEVRILVVDDEEDLAEVVGETLELEDFQVTCCYSGESGLETYQTKGPFHIVLSDSNMPGMDGLELLDKIIHLKEDTPPLFYLCTGDMDISESDIIKRGAKAVMTKPYNLSDLVERIQKDLNLNE